MFHNKNTRKRIAHAIERLAASLSAGNEDDALSHLQAAEQAVDAAWCEELASRQTGRHLSEEASVG